MAPATKHSDNSDNNHAAGPAKARADGEAPRRIQTESQFRKCDACGETLFVKELQKALEVCKVCGYHFQIGARRRLDVLLDPDSFAEMFQNLESVDPLQFRGRRSYVEKLKESQRKTGLRDGVVCGEGKILGHPVAIAAMDYQFISGSMGSVVGEKLTRIIEHATANSLPVIIVCSSTGGARMEEGALSLMQMAKTAAALQRHDKSGLLYISILTHSTLGGVSASFAFLGDFIIAEPRAMIGFTGARVIEQTIKKTLPEGFQRSEFLLEHGQIDMVVERKNLRDILGNLLEYARAKPCEVSARVSAARHDAVRKAPANGKPRMSSRRTKLQPRRKRT